MDKYGRYTRRGFLGLSIFLGFFCIQLPGWGIIARLKEEVKLPLKRLLLHGSYPIMEDTIKKKWVDDSLIITVNESVEPFFKLNKTAGLILERCDGNHAPTDIAKELATINELNEKRAKKEVFDAIEAFYNGGLIRL